MTSPWRSVSRRTSYRRAESRPWPESRQSLQRQAYASQQLLESCVRSDRVETWVAFEPHKPHVVMLHPAFQPRQRPLCVVQAGVNNRKPVRVPRSVAVTDARGV